MAQGTERLLATAKKMGFEKSAFGTDIVTDPPPAPSWLCPEGIATPKSVNNLIAGLLRPGLSRDDICKIWSENWLSIIRQVWGATLLDVST